MSNSTEALVPYPNPASRPAFGFSPLPPEEPSILWTLAVRYSRLLIACAVVSLLIAWGAGWLFGRPIWQAEAVLLYQPVAFTDEQRVAYPTPPSLPTLAGWIKEPKFLKDALAECGVSMSPAAFVSQHLKVDQPIGTEAVSVILKWSGEDSARELLDRLLQQYLDFVAVERKKAILHGARQTKRQDLAVCQADVLRLDNYIRDLQDAQTRTNELSATELDGLLLTHRNDLPLTESWKNPFAQLNMIMVARRSLLEETIFKDRQQLLELKMKHQKELGTYQIHAELARGGGTTAEEVAQHKYMSDLAGQQVQNTEERIKQHTEELRTLPVSQAQKMSVATQRRAEFLQDELQKIDAALQLAQRPGTPLAHRVLTGMDAREFKVESLWMDNQPASTNRRTLTALAFLMLMGLTFGLLFVYDRYYVPAGQRVIDRPYSGPFGGRVVHVSHQDGSGVTIARVDVQRLSVRMHQWIRGDEQVNDNTPAMTIGPDGHVEPARQLPPAADNADHLSNRIHQWLERGPEESK